MNTIILLVTQVQSDWWVTIYKLCMVRPDQMMTYWNDTISETDWRQIKVTCLYFFYNILCYMATSKTIFQRMSIFWFSSVSNLSVPVKLGKLFRIDWIRRTIYHVNCIKNKSNFLIAFITFISWFYFSLTYYYR